MQLTRRGATVAALSVLLTGRTQAAEVPKEIRIGHLHASSGPFASISMPTYYGLKLWVDQSNTAGGTLVKPFGKKIPLKLISYDDQSNPGTAATLINQLITQDKVDLLVSDQGSVLTAVAVPIAREHKMFLFDPGGTGAEFFSKDNPYIALLVAPISTVWPKYLAGYLNTEGAAAGLKSVALLYTTNDFTGTQAKALKDLIGQAGKLKIVYDQGVPTSTSSYTVLINNIAAAQPDAVIALGYPGNDIAFLRNLQGSGHTFKFVFTVYPGLESALLLKNVGIGGLQNVFTYVTGAAHEYKVNAGLNLPAFAKLWTETYANTPGADFGQNAVAGYTVGLILQETLAHTDSMEQLALRKAVFGLSGKLVTISGPFELDANGAQIGEAMPLGQVESDGQNGMKLVVVYPPDLADGVARLGP